MCICFYACFIPQIYKEIIVKVKADLFLWLIKQVPRQEGIWGGEVKAELILSLGTGLG
jgi:hypothetical protein